VLQSHRRRQARAGTKEPFTQREHAVIVTGVSQEAQNAKRITTESALQNSVGGTRPGMGVRQGHAWMVRVDLHCHSLASNRAGRRCCGRLGVRSGGEPRRFISSEVAGDGVCGAQRSMKQGRI
jgi:hypothetical protein